MDSNTRRYIEKSFLEVSRGAARKKLYAIRAELDGNKQLARLFRAIAISDEAQAIRFLLQLRGQIGKNSQNCKAAFEEEIPDLIDQYEKAMNTAAKAGERAMESVFLQSAKVERIHLNLKKKLGNDPAKDSSYHVCTFCGFIMENHAPEKCPICTAHTQRFKEV
jgi:rubrerythrin